MQFGTLDENLGTSPPSQEYPINMPRDVQGPGFLMGRYLRNPGSDWHRRLTEQRMKQNASRGLSGPNLEIILKEESKKEREEFRDRYLAKSGPKMMQGRVHALAKLGMQAVERDLKRRREALRQLLVEDELKWQSLEKDNVNQQATDRFAEAKRFTEKVRAEQEAKRLQLVAEKREQQDREKSEGLRRLQSIKNLYNCTEVNLCQMRDKRDQAESDREVERLYSELNQKLCESQITREEQVARKRLARNCQQMDALRAQVAYQQNQNETFRNDQLCLEAERIRLLQELECKEKEQEQLRKHQDQDKIRANFEDQIALRRRTLVEEADREAAEDERRNRENREYLRRENETVAQNKRSANVEMKMFLNHVTAFKEEQAKQEKETEQMIAKRRKDIEKLMDQRRCEESAARRKLIAKTLEERLKQVREREEMRQWEEELRKEEKEEVERLRQCQQTLKAEYEQRKLRGKREFAEDLRNQLRFQCILKEREEEEEDRFYKRCQEEDEKYQRRIEELMNKPEKFGVHPFRLKIEGKAK